MINPNNSERKDMKPNNPQPLNNKEFYQTSVLKYNILSELCAELTCNEILDPSVEKVNLKFNTPFLTII